ncbi:MAG: hypothetical protein ACK4WH_04020 [Phycisphaerales bacterium]
MSRSPFAELEQPIPEPAPRRTSALAVASLIVAIASIVPLFCVFLGSGALAMMLGGASLLLISRERGRLGGRGLAFAGIVTGLFVTVVQIVAIAVMVKSVGFLQQQLVGPVDQSIRAIERGDLATARKLFTPEADARITDRMLTDFAASCSREFGAYAGPPDSLWGFVTGWFRTGPAMAQLGNNAGNTFPFPVRFATTEAVVVVLYDPQRFDQSQGAGPTNFAFPTINLGVLTADGRSVWITDERPPPGMGQFKLSPPPPASPPAPSGPGEAPPSPDAPPPAPSPIEKPAPPG